MTRLFVFVVAIISITSLMPSCGDVSCDDLIDRYCEQACRCGEQSGHCAASSEPGDLIYFKWANKKECLNGPDFMTMSCPSERIRNRCYDALQDVKCSQFDDDSYGLIRPDECY